MLRFIFSVLLSCFMFVGSLTAQTTKGIDSSKKTFKIYLDKNISDADAVKIDKAFISKKYIISTQVEAAKHLATIVTEKEIIFSDIRDVMLSLEIKCSLLSQE